MEQLSTLDRNLFWWINHHDNPVLDWLMWGATQPVCWIVVLALWFCLVPLRHDRRSWLWVLLGGIVCLAASDQVSSHIIKEAVMRLRPCHALEGVRMFRTRPGSLYGFVSSHAANSFALATLFCLQYGGKRRQEDPTPPHNRWNAIGSGFRSRLTPILLISWAVMTSLSRVYLGKHYPGDIVCGALLGVGIGAGIYFIISKTRLRIASKSRA